MIASIALAFLLDCECSQPHSVVVLDADDGCLYWFYEDDPGRHNPCEDIPGNAFPVWLDTAPEKE